MKAEFIGLLKLLACLAAATAFIGGLAFMLHLLFIGSSLFPWLAAGIAVIWLTCCFFFDT